MVTVLVVDDTPLDRHLAGALIQERAGWTAVFAEDGRQALDLIRRDPPDLVLTDLQMPELNGLELVEAVRREHPGIPVVLMTAYGSEDIAVEALQKGAASYVPKKNLASDLVSTLESVLPVTEVTADHRRVQACLTASEFTFDLTHDTTPLQPLIGHLQDHMLQRKLVGEEDLVRVGTALYEVLLNAIEHGNLELSSELREVDNGAPYKKLAAERRRQSPYKDRTVRLVARFSRDESAFTVRDEGPGFDPAKLPDPMDPENMAKSSGRGLLLIRTFMDDVRFSARGNEVTLVKHRPE
ncbi:response regulator [Limnoglobus roseus]|uniref:ATP-binding protein n=1 Tax=Limnoglobus roseus TaxID=2598579 RepID=A0A5C1ACB3_9BACT|nr:response regulator [Limnoglobus roseus]QEL15392.1 ATP-binding protein [Limnoglobus roseus]